MEDQPFLLKLFLNDYEVEYIDKTTVRYRFNDESITRSKDTTRAFEENRYTAYRLYSRPYLKHGLKNTLIKYYRDFMFFLIFKTVDQRHPFKFLPSNFFLRLVMYTYAKTRYYLYKII